ncbi:MAG: hypothetical protein IKW74_03815, partial [Thermoguttaceae bacterium]|nr:hypothetical protein [Thermoguttaceae bacterium]
EEAVGEERRRSRRNRRHGRKNRNAASEELPPVLKEEKLSRNDEDFAGDDPFSSVVEYESEVPERGRRSKHGRRNHSGESQSNMEQKKMAGKPFGYSDDPESSLVDAGDVEEQESVSKPIKPSIPKSMPSWEDAVSCVVRFNMNRRGQRKKK